MSPSLSTLGLFFQIIYNLPTHSARIKPKVVIVGAGAAGLSAAVKLLENNIDVTVLEAESRIGGRIRTVKFANGYIDLGANFCEGQEGNVVYEMVKDLDLLNDITKPFKILASNNKKIDEDVVNKTKDIFDILNDWDETSGNWGKGIVFTKKYKRAVIRKFPNDVAKQNEALALIKVFKHSIMVEDGTTDWNNAPAANNFHESKGNHFLLWKDKGYKIFLDVLMKKYPNNKKNFDIHSKIQTRKVVEKIIWNEATVRVRCKGGDEIKADYVIFTPSLGVLKAKHDQIFSPALPKKKVKAIQKIGFGIVGILHAHYPEIWWPEDIFSINSRAELLWVDQAETQIREKYSWIKMISEVSSVEGNPNVLKMWIVGKDIASFENIDELSLIDALDYTMRKYFPNTTNIVKADKIARSDWLKNPHFLGSYSHETYASRKIIDPSCVESLMKPLVRDESPVVMFAGEATNPYHYSTVHGAVETGWREAQRILDDIKNTK